MKEGWSKKTIGEICDVIAGQSPEGKFYNEDGLGLPFYQGKKDFGDKYLQAPRVWTKSTTKIACAGDILMSVRAPVGPINFTNEKICIGRGLAAIRASAEVDRDFLYYYLLEQQPKISGNEGAVFASINKNQIEAIPISLPPLAEQRRIVAILDDAFAGLETLRANAEKNVQNAKSLPQSFIDQIFANSGESWKESILGEVCKFIGGSQPPKSDFSSIGGPNNIRLIQIRDYKSDKHIVFIPKSKARRYCDKTDIMIGRYGPPLFQILRGLEGAYNVALMKAVPDESVISKDFLYYFLQNSRIYNFIVRSSARAAGQTGINKETIEPYPISFPSLSRQSEIVKELDRIISEQKRLELVYDKKLAAIDTLKQSLLHRAFSGQLTASETAAA